MAELKINIRYGEFELQIEGNNSDVIQIFNETKQDIIMKMLDNPSLKLGPAENKASANNEEHHHVEEKSHKTNNNLSMTTVANTLNAKTAPEMIEAALAFLTFTSEEGKAFSIKEIRDAMKSATHHYKKNQSVNAKRDIGRLVKDGKVNEQGSNRYVLSNDKLKEVREKIDKSI